MKTLLLTLLFGLPTLLTAQVCTHPIYPHVVSQGTGSFHITSDATMPYNDGSVFYVCAGVHLTIEGSAGSSYYLEDGAMLTILDHDGDAVFAKGNCTIIDQSTETLLVTCESSTSISKPNDPFNYVEVTCTNMVFDYQAVGGSSPCSLNLTEALSDPLEVYPNPITSDRIVHFSQSIVALSLYDVSGRLITEESEISADEIRLEGVKSGCYILTVQTTNGAILTTRIQVQ